MIGFLISILMLGFFFFLGNYIEKKHYVSIVEREKKLINIPAVSLKTPQSGRVVKKTFMVTGSAVISIDYFKRFVAGIKNFIGGRVGTYETLLDRARREAIIRMKQSAGKCDVIMNLKLETAAIGKTVNDGKRVGCVEVLAYGTAITYHQD